MNAFNAGSLLMRKFVLKTVPIASLVAGLVLLAYLIKQTGMDALADYLLKLGWGFALVIALSAVRNVARAAAWFNAIEPEHRQLGFWQLTNVMLAGEAIKYLTSTGPLLGEPAKAAMVRRQVPLLQGFSSVIVESLTYYLSVFIFMLAGLPALAWIANVPDRLKLLGYIFAAVIILFIAFAWMAIRWRWYLITGLLRQVARFAGRRKDAEVNQQLDRMEIVIERVRAVEDSIYTFYERRRGAFILIFALDMMSHLINVVEVYAILAMMGVESSLAIGFVIEAVTKIINLAFFFVPARAGVYESGHAMVVGALGIDAGAGVALAIIRKLRAFVWAGYGLGVIAAITFRERRAARPAREKAQEAGG